METKYILPEYCHIEKVSGKEFQLLMEKEGVNSKYILFNKKLKNMFFINESISNFLELFATPQCSNNICAKMGISDKDGENQINAFIDSMIKRGFLISEGSETNLGGSIKRTFIDYDAVEFLKESEFETVCLAKHKKRKNKVILKFLSFESDTTDKVKNKRRNYFKQEFAIMNKVSKNSSICNLISFDEKNDLAVLEYIEGTTLKELIKNKNLLINQKLLLARQIVSVVAYLHKKNIIHGDIHANQFIVEDNGDLKLIDFGLSLDRNIELSEQVIRRGGIHNYLEPENITPNAFSNMIVYIPNFQSEVYRVGALLYFLFFEKYPFDSFSWLNLFKQIKTKQVEIETKTSKNEKIPTHILDIIYRALSKKPELRFSSAVSMEEYLNQKL